MQTMGDVASLELPEAMRKVLSWRPESRHDIATRDVPPFASPGRMWPSTIDATAGDAGV